MCLCTKERNSSKRAGFETAIILIHVVQANRQLSPPDGNTTHLSFPGKIAYCSIGKKTLIFTKTSCFETFHVISSASEKHNKVISLIGYAVFTLHVLQPSEM